MNKYITVGSTAQIVCFTAGGQWFNAAAPQGGMQMLVPIENKQ